MSISIIVPVYNEEDSLRPLYDEVTAAMQHGAISSYELILVDDGSKDTSVQVMAELFERDPEHVRCIMLRRNFGQTAAMAAGFDAAQGELIIPMDADLQNDPADIPRLVATIQEGYDVVSGWRKDRQDKVLSRKIPSKMANWLISKITGVDLHDYGCTLKAYHRDVTQHLRLYGEMHRFLPALASWTGARVTELPVNHRSRQFGQSKYGIDRTLRVVLDLITVKFLLSYSTKPMQVFGKWGFIAMFIGALAGMWTLGLKIFTEHHNVTGNPYLYIAIFFMLGGLQLICMGLLGELNVRTYYESQQKPIYTIREQLRKD
jgi:glycosyltransferase involved in cell wall biosynthesis